MRQAHLMLIGTAFGGGLLLIVMVEIATRLTSPSQFGLVDRRHTGWRVVAPIVAG